MNESIKKVLVEVFQTLLVCILALVMSWAYVTITFQYLPYPMQSSFESIQIQIGDQP